MHAEHNPIAVLIRQMQQKWMAEVSPYPQLKLVRWLIRPDWARLFEGFLKLEATEHGALPEVLVTLLTPFEHEHTFSGHLVKDWVQAFEEDRKTGEQLAAKGKSKAWDPVSFLSRVPSEDDDLLWINMLASFQDKLMGGEERLVVVVYPRSIQSMEGFRRWLTRLLKQDFTCTFLIFDHIGEGYFDPVFLAHPDKTRTLYCNLDLDGAVSRIARMGNPNDPEVKFRECLLQMGQSLQQKDPKRLHEWGQKGLQVTGRSGLKALYASAHLVYAGMLFQFKEYRQIDDLLTQGLNIALQGMKAQDGSCTPLAIQFYGYIAASRQLQKKNKEAIESYEKQGDLAMEFGLPGMALGPFQQAYTLSRKHLPHRYEALIRKAFETGRSLSTEEKSNSAFAAVASDYLRWQEGRQLWDEARETDEELTGTLGQDWKEKAKKPTAYPAARPQEPAPLN